MLLKNKLQENKMTRETYREEISVKWVILTLNEN